MSSIRYKKIEDLLKSKGNYFMFFNSSSTNEKEELIDLFISSYHDMKKFSQTNFKLKGVITLYKNLSRQNRYEDVIQTFNKEIPYLFNCYKVFFLHKKKIL